MLYIQVISHSHLDIDFKREYYSVALCFSTNNTSGQKLYYINIVKFTETLHYFRAIIFTLIQLDHNLIQIQRYPDSNALLTFVNNPVINHRLVCSCPFLKYSIFLPHINPLFPESSNSSLKLDLIQVTPQCCIFTASPIM